jgi:hypothetical protein
VWRCIDCAVEIRKPPSQAPLRCRRCYWAAVKAGVVAFRTRHTWTCPRLCGRPPDSPSQALRIRRCRSCWTRRGSRTLASKHFRAPAVDNS